MRAVGFIQYAGVSNSEIAWSLFLHLIHCYFLQQVPFIAKIESLMQSQLPAFPFFILFAALKIVYSEDEKLGRGTKLLEG